MTIYTLGHSNRSWEEFLCLVRAMGIRQVVDVRRFPVSRRFPWFSRDALASALEAAGIRYAWLGAQLGGRTQPPYPDYMHTAAFEAGLGELETRASALPMALLCAEKDWRRCHRRFIADALTARGWQVMHLLEPDRAEPHPHILFSP